jgi:acyl-coenzyme A thioesterase PaaI-like protein
MPKPLLDTYRSFTRLPLGAFAFDTTLAFTAPFNASVSPAVKVLEPGRAVLEMTDRPWRRNHVGSVHAMALGTLAEITANLALLASLPEGAQMIPTSFHIDFTKKARGKVVAACSFDRELLGGRPESLQLEVELVDAHGDVVARTAQTCRLRWAT